MGVLPAKNVILTGVRSFTLHDTVATSLVDLSSQFFLSEADVGRNRAEACAAKLAELNPSVVVSTRQADLDAGPLDFLLEFQCVLLVDAPLERQLRVNDFCHAHGIPFIASEVRGVLALAFVDVGEEFVVADATGEAPVQLTVARISNAAPGIVEAAEGHGLQDGDVVQFGEIEGMAELNGTQHVVRVLNFKSFSIGDTTGFGAYSHNGYARQIKQPVRFSTHSLRRQLYDEPDLALVAADTGKFELLSVTAAAIRALHGFASAHAGALPRPWHAEDAAQLCALAAAARRPPVSELAAAEREFVTAVAFSAAGALPPLVAFLGGFVGQEALKVASHKFAPLRQWLALDAREVIPRVTADPSLYAPRGDRYDGLRVCVGAPVLDELARARVFVVGAGAIGCELLKNFALLGVATAEPGLLTVTDNDVIEVSNLSRQFLFRNHDLTKPKAQCACAAVRAINPALRLQAMLERVSPESEAVFTEAFFEAQSVCVNALDNVPARLYMDGRCVKAQRPLLESGTLGTQGHVQTIVPHITESYGAQRDPPEKDVPFCTLKSFPSKIEHTIQFARDRFAELFYNAPCDVNKFFDGDGDRVARLRSGNLGELRAVLKTLTSQPASWGECIAFARVRFQAYFVNSIMQLVHLFPADLKLKDGSPFWAAPKRLPNVVPFSPADAVHVDFIRHTARLWAQVWGIAPVAMSDAELGTAAAAVVVADFRPRDNAVVETDEKADKPKQEDDDEFSNEALAAAAEALASRLAGGGGRTTMHPESFEKDDDGNSHVGFIAAFANLRARNYGIDEVDVLEVKRIAGKIIPAISTTTAAVSGLVALELIKVLMQLPIEALRNAFINLAVPSLALSEPGAVIKQAFAAGASFTVWDRWSIRASEAGTLQQFIEHFATRYQVSVTGVFFGATPLYLASMPTHKTRLKKRMAELIKQAVPHVDLVVAFANAAGAELQGPVIRYHLE